MKLELTYPRTIDIHHATKTNTIKETTTTTQ